ncbi:MAG TPA: ATP-binding protein [Polyangiaceae bacterium]|jgi:signal transduction histidine kinase|nr:ATP-binding protein [Polyangiaceae bacterium]
MRLAPRLVLAFGLVAILSVTGLGYLVREDRRATETTRFEQEVKSACDRVVAEIGRQGESDRKLVAGACQSGELADRALIWLEAGTLRDERRLSLSRLVPEERQAFDLDELILATEQGDRLGQDPMTLLNLPKTEVAALIDGDVSHFALRVGPVPSLVARCRKSGAGGKAVGLAGARHLGPVIDRLAKTIDAAVTIGVPAGSSDDVVLASCTLADASGARVPIVVTKSKAPLAQSLARVDRTTIYAGLASTLVALLFAVLLARNLGGPIARLAAEARKVASGEARPLPVRGAGEIAELAQAFDTMLVDLDSTRRRLAATTRVAAWREVARRVAHEIKNPLAPIRAAVETLRRLRAREDPEFDAYFDQATRTVLDEVVRISNIVTEFTRFARLPQPRPEVIDVAEVARSVVQLHANPGSSPGAEAMAEAGVPLEHPEVALVVESGASAPPSVKADKDQITRVLTNLVQNALDAVHGQGTAGRVEVRVGGGRGQAVVTVKDNGPGLSPEIAQRLFEPYATTKTHGTGLGLAIAQRIAIEHTGELSYVSGTDGERGATFRLVLPVSGPPAVATGNTGSIFPAKL